MPINDHNVPSSLKTAKNSSQVNELIVIKKEEEKKNHQEHVEEISEHKLLLRITVL